MTEPRPTAASLTSLAAVLDRLAAPADAHGGSKRQRWKDRKGQIYEFDYQHGGVEKYNKTGKKHLGEYDPLTGKQTKGPDKDKKPVEPR